MMYDMCSPLFFLAFFATNAKDGVDSWYGIIELLVKVLSAIATTVIAVFVAMITRRQWKTNQEKLRLDLYSRRYNIYESVLTLQQALIYWDKAPEIEQKEMMLLFFKSMHESRFLFPGNSGVFEFMQD